MELCGPRGLGGLEMGLLSVIRGLPVPGLIMMASMVLFVLIRLILSFIEAKRPRVLVLVVSSK